MLIEGSIRIGDRDYRLVNSLDVLLMWEGVMSPVRFGEFDGSVKHSFTLLYCSVYCGGARTVEYAALAEESDARHVREFMDYWLRVNSVDAGECAIDQESDQKKN